MGVWYCNREEVKSAMDSKETARNNLQVDRAIEAASREVESITHRRFYPLHTTRYFDWPNLSWSHPWRLWLDDSELISVTSITSGGIVIPPTDYFLEPNEGPPYDSIEINLSTSSAFSSGQTFQRSIAVEGVFGYRDDNVSVGILSSDITSTDTQIDIDNGSFVGVGDLLKIGDERMTVMARGTRASGQTLLASMASLMNSVAVSVANGAAFHTGEVVVIDSEKMKIVEITGNTLTVIRAWDGSVLAAHSANTPIWVVGWTITVTRGDLGTTAENHSTGAAISKWIAPSPVHLLTVAMAIDTVQQELSAYSRVIGSGADTRDASGRAIESLRERVYNSHGRKARKYAV